MCLHCNAIASSKHTNTSYVPPPPSASLQVGSDHIDLHAASQKGITVVEVSCSFSCSNNVAAWAFELLLLS